MEELINNLTDFIGNFGFISGFLLVFLESMIPVLPLSVFIAVNILTYGSVAGLIVSYLGTIFGCITAYFLVKKFSDYFSKKYNKNKKVNEIKDRINKLSFTNLVILIAIPFTPAFAINIACGLTGYDIKKYLLALVIGKIPMVYFWAYIGTSLKDSLTDITVLARIIFMVLVAYLVSRVVNNFINSK